MLRLIVLVLLLANGAYFAWSQNYLQIYGFGPKAPNEPHRIAQQIKPEALRLLSLSELKDSEAQALAEQAPTECLQAGPFDVAQADIVRNELGTALPANSWQFDAIEEPARWIVYMGKYANPEQEVKKRTELARLGFKSTPVLRADLQPGLALATLDSEAAAQAELERLIPRGIRTAKVLQERPASTAYLLRLPAATEALKSQVQTMSSALQGRPLKPCAKAAPAGGGNGTGN